MATLLAVEQLEQTFLQHLVHIHRLCTTPPPEYPGTLQSQLLVLSRAFGKLADLLSEKPTLFTLHDHDDSFQSCIEACASATEELETALNQYGEVITDEEKWNQMAKPTVMKMQRLITFITPYLRVATSKNDLALKKVLGRMAADVETLNDNESTLTGQTLNGIEEADQPKKEFDSFDDRGVHSTTAKHTANKNFFLSVEETNVKKKHGTKRTRMYFRVINLFYRSHKSALPLHAATDKGSKFTVRRLLYGGANIDAKDSDGKTPLHRAVMAKHEEITRVLLKWDANINAQDLKGATPLMISISDRNRVMSNFLMKSGANVELIDCNETRALHRAAQYMGPQLQDLLDFGADPDAVESDLMSPLHLAVIKNNVEHVRRLLKAGANVNAVDLRQETPLHHSVRDGRENIAKLLVDAGADVDALGLRWETPLAIAVKTGNMALLQLLMNAGADLEAENTEKHRAVHCAIFWNRCDMLKVLLDAGAEVDARGRFGETPLTLAAQDGYLGCAVRLLMAGASTKLEQSSPRGVVVGNALACAKKWERCEELTELLEKLESGEIEKAGEEHLKESSAGPRNPSDLKAWLGKFIVQVHQREAQGGEGKTISE